jgi:DNA-binding helix-hairpin-helix protein with protein kinase domain
MNTSFRSGDTVWLEMAGESCTIGKLLGSGAQAEVYRASFNGRDCALKWYFPAEATAERRASIERRMKKGAPSESFLWPCDLALSKDQPGFGYITPLREARFHNLGELLSRKIDPTLRSVTTACLGLADAFLRLHIEGFCYTRLSLGNIFIDPDTGEIALSENDDLATDGEEWDGGLGAARYLAPELIGGKAGPSVATDHYALAVILFCMLMGHHPMEGRQEMDIECLDAAGMRKLYGAHPLFIFDPKNRANRPVPGVQDNALTFWNFYPGYVREIFLRAFTAGVHDPLARVGENEWRSVFTRMRDQICYCDTCGVESFLIDSGNAPGSLPEQDCWFCHHPLPPPLRIRLVHHAVVLNQDTVLFAHHLDAHRRNDFSQIMAEMAPHPSRPEVWGLKNVSATTWNSVSPAGATVAVPSGRSVSLSSGMRIQFGNVEGTVL